MCGSAAWLPVPAGWRALEADKGPKTDCPPVSCCCSCGLHTCACVCVCGFARAPAILLCRVRDWAEVEQVLGVLAAQRQA